MSRRLSWLRPRFRRPTTPGSGPSTTSRSGTSSAAALVLVLTWAGTAAAQPPPEPDDKVQAYLVRLGLNEYELLYLEGEMDRAPAARREAVARKLVPLYADALLDVADGAAAEAIQKKVTELIKKYPSVSSPQVEVLLLQGDFARAETLVGKWLLDADDTKSRDEAAALLRNVAPDLVTRARKLEAEVKKQQDEIDKLKEGMVQRQRQAAVDKLAQLFGRATFFGAWASYYEGLLRDDASSADSYRRARDMFKKLVQLDKPEPDTDPDELGLGSSVRARSVLGLALAEAGGGDIAAAQKWFELLRKPQVSDAVRPAVDFWQLLALTRARAAADAIKFARERVDGFGDASSSARRNFCVLLLQAGGRDLGGPLAPLGPLGLRGLVQMRQPELARKLADKYGVPTGTESPAGRLIAAFGLLDTAEKKKEKADYRAAAKALDRVLADADGAKDAGLANRVRFQLGYCLVKLEEWAPAAEHLERAVPAMAAAKNESAGDAAWLLIAAYEKLQAKDARVRIKLIDSLKSFTATFPTHPQARSAGTLLAALGGVDLDGKIDPADADAALKMQLVTKRLYQRWRAVKDDAVAGPKAAAEVSSSAVAYLALPADKAPVAGRIEVAFMATDALLTGPKPDGAKAAEFLKSAEELVKDLPLDARAASDFRVLQLQLAQATGDFAVARAAAEWLTKNRKGTPLEEAAYVGVAKTADMRLAAAPAADKPARLDEAIEAYKSLANHLGPTAEKVQGSRNAQVANSRLATLYFDRGKMKECKEILEARLLKAYPKEVKYLRLAGLVYHQTKDDNRALECWRTLTRGLPANTPGWFEAKYYHMATLARTNRADAKQAFEQFKTLHPDLGPADFRDKFKALEKELGG